MKKVSIILTYLDRPKNVCISSIRNQTYENIELVEGREEDFGFKEKRGVGFMRNLLAKKATGDILLFTDSDGKLHRDFVKNIVKIFEKYNPDAVSGLPVAPKRNKTDFLSYILGVEYEARVREMGEGFVSVGAGTCLAVKKNVFEDVGGFIETKTFGEDWAFSKEMENKGYKIWHTNKAQIIIYEWENLWKYLKKQLKYSYYRIYHAKKYKHITDEYPLVKTDFSRYNIKEKLFFPIFWTIRAFSWFLGGAYGFIKFMILNKELKEE